MSSRNNKKRKAQKPDRVLNLSLRGRTIRKVNESHLRLEFDSLMQRSAWREILQLSSQLGDQRRSAIWISNAFFKALEATEQKQTLLSECEYSIQKNPRDPSLLSWLAHALRLNGRVDESVEVLRKAIKLAKPDADLFNSLGSALKETGAFEEAKSWFEKALKIKPGLAKAFWNQSDLVTDHLAATESIEAQLTKYTGPEQDKYLLFFSLYRHYEKLQNFEAAFKNLQQANQLKQNQISYNYSENNALTEQIIKCFKNHESITPITENQSTRPIFVFGLPRSGTTLIEQILASHSEVYGGNELTFLNDASTTVQGQKRLAGNFPAWTSGLDESGWQQIGAKYLSLIDTLPTEKNRVTDKSLLNFRAAGLISRALPNAKMIHVVRDPMDQAFGCYKQNFGTGLLFSYNFEDIAEMILDNHKLVSHWQSTLPTDQYYMLDYQELVKEPNEQIAKLLGFCGLPEEAACYHPEQTERTVRTLSATQVRQPINTLGLGAWKRYEAELEPLQNALRERGLI